MIPPAIERLVELALDEDLGRGDLTSEAIFDVSATAKGRLVAKQPLVLAGLDVARYVFRRVDERVRFEAKKQDGDACAKGDTVATVEGAARSVLAAERTALNFLQRLSGVATTTRRYVDVVQGTSATVIDTRKTAPGWRWLDKAAVRAGGGTNHRADLGSGVLIKDNHVAACGGVRTAVERARARAPHSVKIEVEVSTRAQLDEALSAGADIVLLDNVSPDEARGLVARVREAAPRVLVEVSGGITLETLRAYAEAGVDLVSVGALTHSAKAADLSLEVDVAT